MDLKREFKVQIQAAVRWMRGGERSGYRRRRDAQKRGSPDGGAMSGGDSLSSPAGVCVNQSGSRVCVCVCARVYGCVLQLSTEIYVTGLSPPPPAGPLPLNKRPHPTTPNSSEFKGIFWEYYRTITTINSIRSFTLLICRTITRKWQES